MHLMTAGTHLATMMSRATLPIETGFDAAHHMRSCQLLDCGQVSCLMAGSLGGGMPPSSSLVGPPASRAGSWYRMTRYLLVTRNPVSQKNMRCTSQAETLHGCW